MDSPIHGLSYEAEFLASLPVLLPRPAPHSPIRALTAGQFVHIHLAHSLADVDDAVLFPFLHGIEGDNAAQNMFFANCRRKGDGPVPRYRGLVWVVCEETDLKMSAEAEEEDEEDDEDDEEDEELWSDSEEHSRHPADNNAAVPIDILHDRRASSASSVSSAGSPLSVSTTSTSIFFPTPSMSSLCPPPFSTPSNSNLLTSSLRPNDLLVSTQHGPEFLIPRGPPGISLRNFGIQAPIYATISDIVVYSPKGLTRAAFALAERFKHAIEAKAFERANRALEQCSRPPALIPYNVFIVTDPFEVFERDYRHLVSVDSKGIPVNHVDFAAREKEEMRQLTKATEVGDGIWLGNLNDVPTYNPSKPQNSPNVSDDPLDSSNNPNGYDICIECHDCASFPSMAQLRYVEDHFRSLDSIWERRIAASTPDGDSEMIDATTKRTPPPPPNANSIIHLQFPSSPASTQHTMTHLIPLLNFLSNLNSSDTAKYPDSPSALPHRQRKVLLYSADGYTETSVLALCLLMAQKKISLPEAYLEMQGVRNMNGPGGYQPHYAHHVGISQQLFEDERERTNKSTNRGRSFFVYQSDLGLLRRVESKLRGSMVERERERGMAGREHPSGSGIMLGAREVGKDLPGTGAGRWRWTGLGGWTTARSGSMSASIPPNIVDGGAPPVLSVDTAPGLVNIPAGAESEPNIHFPSPSEESESSPSPMSPTPSLSRSPSPPPVPSTSHPQLPPIPPAPHHRAPSPHSSSAPPHRRARASTSPLLPPLIDHQTWFNDPRFDGTFPSRVLPFLYLGNLNHASNAYMLHALGITHVVSVGECALVPPFDHQNPPPSHPQGHVRSASMASGTKSVMAGIMSAASSSATAIVGGPSKSKPNGIMGITGGSTTHASSLWIEEREGRIKVLDIKGICDDGIDSLRPQFVPICDWIEKARQEGGKVLIHCRVGVSRSATITIAYLMKYANLSLVDAYLIVRSRRLSVLIQPNLIFLANLCSWEIQLARERTKDDLELLKKMFISRKLNWPYLAKEVHSLNEKYLI